MAWACVIGRSLTAVALATVLACAKPEPPVAGRYDASGTDLKRAEDYTHVYASWTRHNRMYEGLENKVFVTGTLLTPEMRQAVHVTYPDVVGHGGPIDA